MKRIWIQGLTVRWEWDWIGCGISLACKSVHALIMTKCDYSLERTCYERNLWGRSGILLWDRSVKYDFQTLGLLWMAYMEVTMGVWKKGKNTISSVLSILSLEVTAFIHEAYCAHSVGCSSGEKFRLVVGKVPPLMVCWFKLVKDGKHPERT